LVPVGKGLCQCHMDKEASVGLSYGRVDGPVPIDKLLEFERAAAESSSGAVAGTELVPPTAVDTKAVKAARGRSRSTLAKAKAKQKGAKTKEKENCEPADRSTTRKGWRCRARVWASGLGGQCHMSCDSEGGLCSRHAAEAQGGGCPSHGFIDGDIPEAKLQDFKKKADKEGWSMPSPEAPPPALSRAVKRPASRK